MQVLRCAIIHFLCLPNVDLIFFVKIVQFLQYSISMGAIYFVNFFELVLIDTIFVRHHFLFNSSTYLDEVVFYFFLSLFLESMILDSKATEDVNV